MKFIIKVTLKFIISYFHGNAQVLKALVLFVLAIFPIANAEYVQSHLDSLYQEGVLRLQPEKETKLESTKLDHNDEIQFIQSVFLWRTDYSLSPEQCLLINFG